MTEHIIAQIKTYPMTNAATLAVATIAFNLSEVLRCGSGSVRSNNGASNSLDNCSALMAKFPSLLVYGREHLPPRMLMLEILFSSMRINHTCPSKRGSNSQLRLSAVVDFATAKTTRSANGSITITSI